MADTPSAEKDPVVSQSLSFPLLISALLLVVTLMWSLFDEAFWQRPWKEYQREFVGLYTAFLQSKAIPEQTQREQEIRNSAEYQRLQGEVDAAEQAARTQVADIDRQSRLLAAQILVLNKVFAEARGEVQALTYNLETAASDSAKASYREDIEEARQEPREAELPSAEGNGAVEEVTFSSYEELETRLNELKTRKAELEAQRVRLDSPRREALLRRDAYMRDQLGGLTSEQLNGLVRNMETFRVDINSRQIHVADVDLVDRCQACHLAIRESLTVTAADMGGRKEFTSHPTPELLRIHDPERFGCTPCHNGNGRATTSVEKAHGNYLHWLWPLFRKENMEAGCQQCHTRDMILNHASTLSMGKYLFDHRGCVGCHRYEGYDTEAEEFLEVQRTVRQKQEQKRENLLEAQRSVASGDRAATNEEARRLYQLADNLRVTSSGIDAEIVELNARARNLLKERKKVAPSLKEVRVKLNPNWLPVWISNPQEFRPGARMPRFRLEENQIRAISAFIWQSGVEGMLPNRPRGDAARGKALFESRGCLACHSVGEGEQRIGGTFAANLSRIGEKANYNYLVRWVHNPRERTRPYCTLEKRDLGPEDYARHNLPFVFDLEHSTCPNDGSELQVQQMTVMPSLRLSFEESQDIASYLMTLKTREPSDYPPATYLNDPALRQEGQSLARLYGCAGCHEIAGMEDEGRIGTELTKEGSKPIEQIDFALLTHPAEREGWYNHKGFFERKLQNPAVFDQGKERPPLERLRMPNFDLNQEEITALTTFLMGSVESGLPDRYWFRPGQQGQDIQEGWKVVLKYNCMGCHELRIGQRSVLMDLPQYQTPEGRDQLPPQLIGEGARVDPLWLANFLNNPSMSETNTDRNGVRPYLRARMPTFYFSQGEILKLVRFFEALSAQAQPYLAPKLAPLSAQELSLARGLFTSPGAPCLECHATGDPTHDQRATAPNFLLMRNRLKPEWARRWMLDPALIDPGTAMPSGLFRPEGARQVFNAQLPPGFQQYAGDHADLIVRYIFQFTPEEMSRLGAR
jgi:cytochrome c551/c552